MRVDADAQRAALGDAAGQPVGRTGAVIAVLRDCGSWLRRAG